MDGNTQPCIPPSRPGFRITSRLPDQEATVVIAVRNPQSRLVVVAATLDGQAVPVAKGTVTLALPWDGVAHHAEMVPGSV